MTDNDNEAESVVGTFTVERWMAFLWAEATRNEEAAFRYESAAKEYGSDRQLVPPEFAMIIAHEAINVDLKEREGLDPDPDKGMFHAGESYNFEQPLVVGETYTVTAEITNVERKEGNSGEFDLVTTEFEVVDTDGDPVFDTNSRAILMR